MSDKLALDLGRRTSRASLLGTWLDGGEVSIYAGERPSTPADPPAGALLTAFTLLTPAGEVVDDVWISFTLPDPSLVSSTGTASWGRLSDASANPVGDLDVGLTGSGAGITLDQVDLIAGGLLRLTSLTITEPA